MSNRRRNHSESINSQQISHTNADGHCNRSAGSSGSLKTRVCQHRTASDEALTAIETVAGTGTECPASNRIDTSRPFKHIDAAHDSLTTVFDKSENVSDVHSPAFEVTTDNRDAGAQDIGKLTTVKVDKTEVTENVVSDTMNSVYSDHVHRYEDLVDTSSAREPEDHDLDVFGCEKRSPVDNVVNIINGPLSTNLLAHDCEAVSDSQSPPDNTFAADNAAGGRSSEFSMNKKRKVSAARSALYRRLLSSDPAEASDVDVSSDIFDSQSLSSDEDSDANDLNLSSDHSCLVIILAFSSTKIFFFESVLLSASVLSKVILRCFCELLLPVMIYDTFICCRTVAGNRRKLQMQKTVKLHKQYDNG